MIHGEIPKTLQLNSQMSPLSEGYSRSFHGSRDPLALGASTSYVPLGHLNFQIMHKGSIEYLRYINLS
jgi:hypothetical protein